MYFLTELKEGLIISFRAIRANKMRSVLTTLGIIIGIVVGDRDGHRDRRPRTRRSSRSATAFGTDVAVRPEVPLGRRTRTGHLIRNRPRHQDRATPRRSSGRRRSRRRGAGRGDADGGHQRRQFARGRLRHRHDPPVQRCVGHDAEHRRPVLHRRGVRRRPPGLRHRRGRRRERSSRPATRSARRSGSAAHPYTRPRRVREAGRALRPLHLRQPGLHPPALVREPLRHQARRHHQRRIADVEQMEDAKLELEGIMRKLRKIAPGEGERFQHQRRRRSSPRPSAPITLVVGVDRPLHHRPVALRRAASAS